MNSLNLNILGEKNIYGEDTSSVLEGLLCEYKIKKSPLEVDFRSLVSWVRLGDQLTHQIHPYPAKLLPNIVHFFIKAKSINLTGGAVLDPFCGSGTVALEASMAGLDAWVSDANPLALMITRVKTENYRVEKLERECEKVLRRLEIINEVQHVEVVNGKLWYSKKNKFKLEMIRSAIEIVEDQKAKDFLLICFSVVARRFSYADPDISVPVRLKCKEKFGDAKNKKILTRLTWIDQACPIQEFSKVCATNLGRIAVSNQVFPGRKVAVTVGNDARKLNIKDRSVPLIITSPPYGSAQKYIRASSLSLNWLGLSSPKELGSLNGKSIGREFISRLDIDRQTEKLPTKVELLLNCIGNQNQVRERITRQYLLELRDSIKEMARVINDDGYIVIVVGNNAVCGNTLRNDEFIVECMLEYGLNIKLWLLDHIKSRGLMTKRNRTASVISRESVLLFSRS